jgi:hypothetical protein
METREPKTGRISYTKQTRLADAAGLDAGLATTETAVDIKNYRKHF